MHASSSSFDIQALLTPAAYPHPVAAITLQETHVSWVILTGSYVYKIKKPLLLDFIDAATLERRAFLCAEELRLNRRIAAELYIEVVPVTNDNGRLRMGGHGQAVEYAVKMQQFEAADELVNLLETGAVSRSEIEQLAELLSTFHALSPSAPVTEGLPFTPRLQRAVLTNLHELRTLQQPLIPRAQVERIGEWLHERCERERSPFEQRERCGFIRECHGDLHAGNIVRYRERLLPFDCLEFDPDLRWIDVMDDIAFIVMDLASHSREDLASALLSRYVECSGDYSGLHVLPFYAVHRALVRAKVDALSVGALPHRHADFGARLQRRVRSAASWSESRHPVLILMHGVSGSGKSWLSERLVTAVPTLRIRSDVERKRLAGVSADESASAALGHGMYSREFTQRTYARLRECAAHCLQSGFNTLIDATLLDAADREQFRRLAQASQGTTIIVACASDPAVMAQRIRDRAARGERTSDADTAVLAAQLRDVRPFAPEERKDVITVDTSEPNAVTAVSDAIRPRAQRV